MTYMGREHTVHVRNTYMSCVQIVKNKYINIYIWVHVLYCRKKLVRAAANYSRTLESPLAKDVQLDLKKKYILKNVSSVR